jgi:hypothetical protein
VAPQTGTVFPGQNLLDVGLTSAKCFGAAGAMVAAAADVLFDGMRCCRSAGV